MSHSRHCAAGDTAVAPTLPGNLNKLSIAELLTQLRLRGSLAARGKKADLIGQLQVRHCATTPCRCPAVQMHSQRLHQSSRGQSGAACCLQKLIDEQEAETQQQQQDQVEQQLEQQPPQSPPPPLPPQPQYQQQDGDLAAGEPLPDVGDALAPPPAAEQSLFPGMPDGYSDIFDRNLNDFSDDEINQVARSVTCHYWFVDVMQSISVPVAFASAASQCMQAIGSMGSCRGVDNAAC